MQWCSSYILLRAVLLWLFWPFHMTLNTLKPLDCTALPGHIQRACSATVPAIVCRAGALGKTVEAVLSSRKHPGLLKQLHDNVDSLQKSRCLSSPTSMCHVSWRPAAHVPACCMPLSVSSLAPWEGALSLASDGRSLGSEGVHLGMRRRVALRKAYITCNREFIASIETGATLERTPDDSLRYQSVTFSLIRALDKVVHPCTLPCTSCLLACPFCPLTAARSPGPRDTVSVSTRNRAPTLACFGQSRHNSEALGSSLTQEACLWRQCWGPRPGVGCSVC